MWLVLVIPALLIAILLFLLSPKRHPVVTALRPGPTGTINILIIGKDARAIGPVEKEGYQRNKRERSSHSDVMIIAHVNLDSGRLNLFALPRDLLVNVTGITKPNSATDFNRMEKLTHIYAIGGESLLCRTIESLLGITIHRSVAFDFDTFRMTFGLLRPFLRNLKVRGIALSNRNQALKFARRRYRLKDDDIDRCRDNLLLVSSVIHRTWWLADTRLGEMLIQRVLKIIGNDTDLPVEEAKQIVYGLKESGFNPDRIRTAVLVGEGRKVTLERYKKTFWCYLPAYAEIRKQVDCFLRDQRRVQALDFMTRQRFRAPGYLFADYIISTDSSAFAKKLKGLEKLDLDLQPEP